MSWTKKFASHRRKAAADYVRVCNVHWRAAYFLRRSCMRHARGFQPARHLQKESQLHAPAVPQVVLRMQCFVHRSHAQREGRARKRRDVCRPHNALCTPHVRVPIVGSQIPGWSHNGPSQRSWQTRFCPSGLHISGEGWAPCKMFLATNMAQHPNGLREWPPFGSNKIQKLARAAIIWVERDE